ncbi:glycosyl transferase family 90-domain-containing protein [Mycena sanguinolenta]|nr:glycosyl transferase family 90-domain-containing protein [Mycena sanguinolenta]
MNHIRRIARKFFKPSVILPFDDAEDSVLLRSVPYTDNDFPRPDSPKLPRRSARAQRWRRRAVLTMTIFGILAAIVFFALLLTYGRLSTVILLFTDWSAFIVRREVDALYARQSGTLVQASARYSLRTGRPPPPYYADFYRFARKKRCLIDEYDRIYRDFEPFYQLSAANATYFQDMVDRAQRAIEAKEAEIAIMVVQDGAVNTTGYTPYGGYLPDMIGMFSKWLPNMTFFLNGKDEPRIAFDWRAPGARESAYLVNDEDPFQKGHRPTAEFFAQQPGCDVALSSIGFKDSATNYSGFLIDSSKPAFTTDLYPMFSMATITPCFADILYPTSYYYDRTFWSGDYAFLDEVSWDEKKTQIYWRGMGSGGLIIGDNYHRFPRYRLMRLGQAHPDLLDVRITSVSDVYCRVDHEASCDRAKVEAEYNITGVVEPRENSYKYKYVLDVDGATFSGRFVGLLRTRSLVFKSTIFEEYFNDWIRPYEHFVPVLPDLSDLVEKVQWAIDNPKEAQLIQKRGREVAWRLISDNQNDCYMYAATIEWAQLLDYAKSNST